MIRDEKTLTQIVILLRYFFVLYNVHIIFLFKSSNSEP